MTKFRLSYLLATSAGLLALPFVGPSATVGAEAVDRAPAWRPVASSHGEVSYAPEPGNPTQQIAYDQAGNLHFVYSAIPSGGRGTEIFYRRFDRVGQAVGSPILLPSDSEFNVAPVILVESNGRAHVSWLEVSASEDRNRVRYVRLDGKDPAIDATRVFDVGEAKPFPNLALSPDGAFLWCVFAAIDGRSWQFRVFESASRGEAWEKRADLECGLSCGDRKMRVAVDPESGSVLLVWTRRSETGEAVMAKAWSQREGWAAETVQINDGAEGMFAEPQVLMAGGRTVAAWEIRRLNQRRIAVDWSFDGGRTWQKDQILEVGGDQAGYRLFLDREGTVTVAGWRTPPPRPQVESFVWLWSPMAEEPGGASEIWKVDGRIREMERVPLAERRVLTGVVETGRDAQRLVVLDLAAVEKPFWVDLEGAGVYYDYLGVSQGAFGGKFVAGVRELRPVPLMRGASFGKPTLALAEVDW